MKNSIKLLLISCVITFTGCDFFDNSSPSTTSPDVMFTSITKTEGAIAGVYEIFGEDKSYRNRLACGFAGLNTDIEYNRNSSSNKKGYASYKIQPSDVDLSDAKGRDPWGYLNAMIERCNNIVEGINKYAYASAKSKADTAAYNYLKGEALFLRSFVLLEKVKYWGDVPVDVVPFDGFNIETLSPKKVDRNVAFEQIRKDLKMAAELMPWSSEIPVLLAKNDVRRANKAAALALLARADLMYAGKAVRPTALVPGNASYSVEWNVQDPEKRDSLYKEVMWACNEVIIREGGFKLKQDFERIFRDLCEDRTDYSSMEYLWVIPMANGARGQFMNYHSPKFNAAIAKGVTYTMGILLHNKEYSDDVKSQGVLAMVPTLLFDYAADDVRRDVTVWPFIWNVDRAENADKTLTDQQEKDTMCLFPKIQTDASQWMCGKYRIEWMSRDNTSIDDGIDFPVIRYADVLLMFAEATIMTTPYSDQEHPNMLSGIEALNTVRRRAKVADAPECTIEAIQEERKFEFAGEYIRKWDLMRWGILKEKMIEAHERLEDLRTNHEGHKFYVKYKIDPEKSYLQDGGISATGKPVHVQYLVDAVYGFRMEEEGDGDSKWVNKGCAFRSKLAPSTYMLYDYENPDCLESRQYWPIFSVNVGASNGTLFNNYGY